jgi:hypothetical protein
MVVAKRLVEGTRFIGYEGHQELVYIKHVTTFHHTHTYTLVSPKAWLVLFYVELSIS